MNILTGNAAAAGLLAVLMIGCAPDERNGGAAPASPDVVDRGLAPDSAASTARVVLFMGTSLTAGLGLSREEAFPALLQHRIEAAGLPFRAVNAGVSGETSAGALRRIDWLLQQPFDVLVLETGANDMLRGVDPAQVESNIQQIIDRVRAERPEATIVLAGMRAAPNLGARYVADFEAIYPRLSERNGLPLLPFILDGVAADRSLNQEDGMHPNAEGQRVVAQNLWETLEPVLSGSRPEAP